MKCGDTPGVTSGIGLFRAQLFVPWPLSKPSANSLYSVCRPICGPHSTMALKINKINGIWRREWDSNPRYGCPYTRFPSERLQPLGHPSAQDAGEYRCQPIERKRIGTKVGSGANTPARWPWFGADPAPVAMPQSLCTVPLMAGDLRAGSHLVPFSLGIPCCLSSVSWLASSC